MSTMPGLRGVAQRTSPVWLFCWAQLLVRVNLCFVPLQSRQSLRPLFQVLRPKFTEKRIIEAAKRYCLIRKWRRYLLQMWPAWAERHDQWFEFEGRENLNAALKQGKGALLLSPHAFGFGRFVAPVLAQQGYRCHRVGLGWQGNDISERWGKDDYKRWQHIYYRWESWKNIEALKGIKTALEQNEVVHVSVRGMSNGEKRFEIPFWYEKYFFDARLLRAIEFFQAPVIPCFSRLDGRGKVIVVLNTTIAPSADAIVAEFGTLYRSWLEEFPELSRIWKRVSQQRQDW
jgi:lauroyl/myristoyl acyltransferase